MATANPLREDNYELELCRVREKIKTKFVELIDCLKARENELLSPPYTMQQSCMQLLPATLLHRAC